MGLSQDQSLSQYGTVAYTGWGEVEAAADARSKGLQSGNNGGVPSFNFDYAGEAQKAYGELGVYYDRILKESQGDLNKALSRLTEDYDRGLRIKKEDTNIAQAGLEIAKQQAAQRSEANAIQRGIYSKSAYDPNSGYGVADTQLNQLMQPFATRATGIDTALSRYTEQANIQKKRQETDLPEQQRRNEANMERTRRVESGELANTRGQKAYQDYLNKYSGLT